MLFDSSSDEEDAQIALISKRRKLRDAFNPLDFDDEIFINNFRLSKEAFVAVFAQIEQQLIQSKNTSSIPNILKLASVLRFLAHDTEQLSSDLALESEQCPESQIFTEVFNALQSVLCSEWINFNLTEEEMHQERLYFYTKTRISGCIGAMDGTHIRIVAPTKRLRKYYNNKKGFFSINALILCDHKMRIRYVNAIHPGATSDAVVFQGSELRTKLAADYANGSDRAWVLADAAYSLHPYLMTPYKCAEEGSAQSYFNKKHEKARNIIEKTINLLKNRFQCLQSFEGLNFRPEKATTVINICAALHNICLHFNVKDVEFVDLSLEDEIIQDGDYVEKILTEPEIIRNDITEWLTQNPSC